MKQVAIAAVALIAGLVLGGLQPRAEVRELREELTEARNEAPAIVPPGQLGNDLATFFSPAPCPPAGRAPTPREEADAIEAANPEAAALAAEIDAEADAVRDELEAELEDMEAPSDEEIELAKTALDLRRAQSRAALVEDTRPDDEQLEAVDAAYAEMNDVLVELSDELVGMLADGELPTRRDAMEFTADALDAMLAAEETVEGLFDPDQLDGVDPETMNPFNYIDPAIVDGLRELDRLPEL